MLLDLGSDVHARGKRSRRNSEVQGVSSLQLMQESQSAEVRALLHARLGNMAEGQQRQGLGDEARFGGPLHREAEDAGTGHTEEDTHKGAVDAKDLGDRLAGLKTSSDEAGEAAQDRAAAVPDE